MGAAYGSYLFEPHWTNLIAAVVGAGAGLMVGRLLDRWVLTPLICMHLVPQKIRAAVKRMTHSELVAAVFPEKRSDPWSYPTGNRLPVRFPEPPAEVAQKLAKLRGSNIEMVIVASAEAIAFPEDVGSLLSRMGQHYVYAHSFRRFGRCGDPIICAVKGTAMVIIDQFGDIALEEETVKKIVDSDFLI